MKTTGFSEFSFGYAVTEELVSRLKGSFSGAPVFPSLYEEGRPGGGYDLMLNRPGFPLLIQFKLSEKMVRDTAKEVKVHGILTTPFYRIPLMPQKVSRQHEMLLSLDNGSNEVYYVAPIFNTQDELNRYYENKEVVQNCVFTAPKTIGSLPDENEHHISVDENVTKGYLLSSEPRRLELVNTGDQVLTNLSQKLDQEEQSLRQNIRSLSTLLETTIESHLGKSVLEHATQGQSRASGERSILSPLYQLANYYYSAQVILLAKP